LKNDEMVQVNDKKREEGANVCIVGIGTGLGCA